MGTVYLVGAGPGDPALLTLRAAELLARADVVVHDVGVPARVLERAAGAELLPAPEGERERVALLVEVVSRAGAVVRLTAGEPFAPGGGSAEAGALRRAGIAFEVVAGVHPGLAAAASAGIPVAGAGAGPLLLVGGAGGEGGAVVAHEPGAGVEALVERVRAAGVAASTPAAAVVAATLPGQRVVVARLGELVERAGAEGAGGAETVIAGEVVRLRRELGWFEARPLFGRRVAVTRPRVQAPEFVAALEELGAEVLTFPMIRIVPPEDPAPLRRAVRRVGSYDWLVFTSANGVDCFWRELEAAGLDARALGGVRVACIGPATAAALAARSVRADLVPERYVAEAVLEALAAQGELAGRRVLLPRAAGARAVLPEGLAARGAVVDEVEAYRSVPDAGSATELRRRLAAGEVDVVTFTSSSTVENFVAAVGTETGGALIAAIGPITAETARKLGLPVALEAEEHTIPGLIRALVMAVGGEPRQGGGAEDGGGGRTGTPPGRDTAGKEEA